MKYKFTKENKRITPQVATDRNELFEELEWLFNRYAEAKDAQSESEIQETIFLYLEKAVRNTTFDLDVENTYYADNNDTNYQNLK